MSPTATEEPMALPPQPPKQSFTLRQYKYKRNRLKGLSQEDAAIAAGYSQSYAAHHAFKIERAVKGGIITELNRAGGTDKVLARELIGIATFDPRRLYDSNGHLLPVSDWPDDVARVIASIETDELWEREGRHKKQVGETKKVRFLDKMKAIELIAKLKKHLNDQPIIDNSETHNYITLDTNAPLPVQSSASPAVLIEPPEIIVESHANGNGAYG